MKRMQQQGFTLAEVLIAVCIVAILFAITLPVLHGHSSRSRDAVARDALSMMRKQIELYRFEHKGLVPGYVNTAQATLTILTNQFLGTSALTGMASSSTTPTSTYRYGPYLKELPVNPFNGLSTITYVPSATAFSAAVTEASGWLYKKETAEFRLNKSGTDSEGIAYLDY